MPGEEDWQLEFPETEHEAYLLREGWLPTTERGREDDGLFRNMVKPPGYVHPRYNKADRLFLEMNRLGGAREEKFRPTKG